MTIIDNNSEIKTNHLGKKLLFIPKGLWAPRVLLWSCFLWTIRYRCSETASEVAPWVHTLTRDCAASMRSQWRAAPLTGGSKQWMNSTATTAPRQMGIWKQLRFEINIASYIVLTGRLRGRRIAHCNRITDTLDMGKALSFSIRPTFEIDPCTAAAAGVIYKGVKKERIQNRVHTSTVLCTPSGDTSVTSMYQKDLRSPADISRKHLQEAETSRCNSGFYLHRIKRWLSRCTYVVQQVRAEIYGRKIIISNNQIACNKVFNERLKLWCLSTINHGTSVGCFPSQWENVCVRINRSSLTYNEVNVFLDFTVNVGHS